MTRECNICGVEFVPTHGNNNMCHECHEIIQKHRGRCLPRRYECPVNIEIYEEEVRKRNTAAFHDTIVAIGYADRQRAKTLEMAGKVKTEL